MKKTTSLYMFLVAVLACVSIAQAGQPDIPDGFTKSWLSKPLVNFNNPYNMKINGGKVLGKDCSTLGECWDKLIDANPANYDYTIVSQDYSTGAIYRIIQIQNALKEAGVKVAIAKFIVEKIPEQIPPKTIAILSPGMYSLRYPIGNGQLGEIWLTGIQDKDGRVAITLKVSTDKVEKVFSATAQKVSDFGVRELTHDEIKAVNEGKSQFSPDEINLRRGAEQSMMKSLFETQNKINLEVAAWLAKELALAKKQDTAKTETK